MRKKIIYSVCACAALLAGCAKNGDGGGTKDLPDVTIRYEASVSDPVNFKINVGYMDKTDTRLKTATVESPFTHEMTAGDGQYLYISARPESRTGIIPPGTPKTVTVRLYIGGKLHEEATNGDAAIVQHIYGTPK